MTVNLKKIIQRVSNKFTFEVYAGEEFLETISVNYKEINLLGLELAGEYEGLKELQIQVIDSCGINFLKKLKPSKRDSYLAAIFSYNLAAIIFTDGEKPDEKFINLSFANRVPILVNNMSCMNFIRKFEGELEKIFAPNTNFRGTMLEVYGIGVLVTGKSDIGKSECAIDLLKRGHRLIGDDIVEIIKRGENVLLAKGKYPISNRMELRGVGIIDIIKLLGISAIKDVQKVELVVNLERWQSSKTYERLGLEEKRQEILGVKVPIVEIPVAPGRNTAILIEVAAMNYRLRKKGVVPAEELERDVLKEISDKKNGN